MIRRALDIPSIEPNYFAVLGFFIQDYAAHVPSALGIPSIEPNDFAVLGFFIQDYAAHVPSALDIPSIEPKLLCSFWFFYSGLCCACSQRIGHSKHSA